MFVFFLIVKNNDKLLLKFEGFVLESMKKGKIIRADVGHKGTQLKLTISFEGGQSAVFKPKWFVNQQIVGLLITC